MVAKYVNETDNHVLYRVTPIFSGDNLLADGVLMEAKSVEDNGEGICFNVFCYNVQPGITIDYATGDSTLAVTTVTPENNSNNSTEKNTTQNIETSKTTEPEVTNKEQEQQSVSEQPQTPSTSTSKYAVNAKNGKIHIVGACPATKEGDNAMKEPVYFDTYEDAEAYSISIAPSQDKRNCGNCW
jgi:DNA-entry nuclease